MSELINLRLKYLSECNMSTLGTIKRLSIMHRGFIKEMPSQLIEDLNMVIFYLSDGISNIIHCFIDVSNEENICRFLMELEFSMDKLNDIVKESNLKNDGTISVTILNHFTNLKRNILNLKDTLKELSYDEYRYNIL